MEITSEVKGLCKNGQEPSGKAIAQRPLDMFRSSKNANEMKWNERKAE